VMPINIHIVYCEVPIINMLFNLLFNINGLIRK
jgi:hypothetical protein